MEEVLYLKNTDVRELLTMADIIPICEEVFKGVAEGTSLQENALVFMRPGHDFMRDPFTDFVEAQPAFSRPMHICGIKTIIYFLGNVDKGLPILSSLMLVADPETGIPRAYVEGEWIVGMRTAANDAVGAKYLAKKDSSSLAIIGCGLQGRTHLIATKMLFDIKDVRIHDRYEKAMKKYIADMAGMYPDVNIRSFDNPKDAVNGADIVCMVTTSYVPVVFEDWIGPGCLVCATHSFSDFDIKATRTFDKYVIGDPTCDVNISKKKYADYDEKTVYARLGEVILGWKPGRESDQERIIWHHKGVVGLSEVAVAVLAYERAKEKGIGVKLERSPAIVP